jgi:hypothetical protein
MISARNPNREADPQAKFFRDKRIVGDSNRMATSWKLLILKLAAAPKPEDGNSNKAANRNPVNELLTDFNYRAARARPFDQRICALHPLIRVQLP